MARVHKQAANGVGTELTAKKIHGGSYVIRLRWPNVR